MSIEVPEGTQSPGFSIMPLGAYYEKTRSVYFEQGMRNIKDSGAEETLRALADRLRVKFADTVLLDVSSMLPRGAGLVLEWDYQKLGPFDPPIEQPSFKTQKGVPLLTARNLGVFADPLTREIVVVNGRYFGVVVEGKKWSSDQRILRAIIATSFRHMVTNLRNVSSVNNEGVKVI